MGPDGTLELNIHDDGGGGEAAATAVTQAASVPLSASSLI